MVSKTIPRVVSEQRAISAMERYAGATSQLKQIEAQEALKIFAMETKQIFFSGKKSLHLRHGTIGFRTGTSRVVKNRSLTWEAALRLFKHKEWPCERQGRGG